MRMYVSSTLNFSVLLSFQAAPSSAHQLPPLPAHQLMSNKSCTLASFTVVAVLRTSSYKRLTSLFVARRNIRINLRVPARWQHEYCNGFRRTCTIQTSTRWTATRARHSCYPGDVFTQDWYSRSSH